jgi:hypothetical protein
MSPRMRLLLSLILLRAIAANIVALCDLMLTGSKREATLARCALLHSIPTLRRRARRALESLL